MNQMTWMGIGGLEHTQKILHLNIDGVWKPYHRCQSLAVADYDVPQGSPGFATMQRLLKKGWTVVPAPVLNAGDPGFVEPDEGDTGWGAAIA